MAMPEDHDFVQLRRDAMRVFDILAAQAALHGITVEKLDGPIAGLSKKRGAITVTGDGISQSGRMRPTRSLRSTRWPTSSATPSGTVTFSAPSSLPRSIIATPVAATEPSAKPSGLWVCCLP